MKRVLALLPLVCAGSSMSADWQVTQSDSVSNYVLCHEGDCPARTAKVLDLPAPVPLLARGSDKATKPAALPLTVSVHFELASARLSQPEQAKLMAFLEEHRAAGRFLVRGSTDQLGKKRFNEALAIRRGQAVAAFLQANGVQKRDIKVESRCCIEHPPTTNPNARRAVISIIE